MTLTEIAENESIDLEEPEAVASLVTAAKTQRERRRDPQAVRALKDAYLAYYAANDAVVEARKRVSPALANQISVETEKEILPLGLTVSGLSAKK